jgi:hypothetical protein
MPFVLQLKRSRVNRTLTWVGLALSVSVPAAMAVETTSDKMLAQQVLKLLDRVAQLEQRNQSLERRVEDLSKAAAPPAVAAGSGNGELADSRLKSIELQQQNLEQQVQALARPLEPDEEAGREGPTFGASLLGVYQQVNKKGGDSGSSQGRFNYRGDVTASLPAGSIGDARGLAFGQLRFGQGGGVALRPTHTGTVNTTTFEAAAGSDQTYAIVAQVYYQLEWPLDGGRFNDQASSRVEMTLGKLDIFAFFDQNAVAGDEGASFLNNVFVHNPMLDSGGDIGADAYGFAPGARAAYFGEADEYSWGASVGVFASGDGAKFSASPGQPLVIVQAQVSPKQINGEPRGNYRVYAWSNGRTTDFEGHEQRHTGIGLSIDQRVGSEWNLFGRYGQRTSGHAAFDRALTVGFEHGGRLWGRGRDAVGLAVGSLSTSSEWRRATAADNTLVGFRSSGQERIAELYYRLTLNDKLAITPDFQLIHRPGGDGRAPTARVFGVRASLSF